jgi:hypothetical protein
MMPALPDTASRRSVALMRGQQWQKIVRSRSFDIAVIASSPELNVYWKQPGRDTQRRAAFSVRAADPDGWNDRPAISYDIPESRFEAQMCTDL